jgi:hypothetical protein
MLLFCGKIETRLAGQTNLLQFIEKCAIMDYSKKRKAGVVAGRSLKKRRIDAQKSQLLSDFRTKKLLF